MILRRAFSSVFLLALGVRHIQSQTVPAISGDLTIGAGPTAEHIGDTFFRTSSATMFRADLAVRLGGAGQTRVVAVLGYSFDLFPADQLTDCPLAPNGTCKSYFPNTFGPSIGVGLRHAFGNLSQVGATIGVAWYSSQARFAALDASFRISPHFSLVGRASYIDMPLGTHRAWFEPLSAGVRIDW